MGLYELDSSGSGEGPVNSCKHGNILLDFIEYSEILELQSDWQILK
jgi:hypothetical protein